MSAAASYASAGQLDAKHADQLLAYITGSRWFAGKGRLAELGSLTPLPWLTPAGKWPAVRQEIAELVYIENAAPDSDAATVSPRELYQLAISYHRSAQPRLQHAEVGRFALPDLGPVVAYDAAQDPAACSVLLDRLLQRSRFGLGSNEVRFRLTDPGPLRPDLEPQVFSGQQSNTSVMFGDVAMVKLFRRLEIGHNLDIEVHEALSRSEVADVAALYGWVEATWSYGREVVSADLAMVVEKLAQAQDGWELALSTLRAEQGFATQAAALGRALAEIHGALQTAFGVDRQPGTAVATIMKQRLAAAAAVAPALEPHVDGLLDCFNALRGRDLTAQRVHGDFHLGQTLHTPGGWKIIDFEGEPVKTLAERAAPDSPWRDIAGMLRSFDYAAASVPGPASADWAAACRTAFLEGYAGGRLNDADAAVLRAYEADKAVYEVVYEVRNRPDWVSIPLAAVAALARASAVDVSGED